MIDIHCFVGNAYSAESCCSVFEVFVADIIIFCWDFAHYHVS